MRRASTAAAVFVTLAALSYPYLSVHAQTAPAADPVQPRAFVSGPTTVRVGDNWHLDFTGSAAEKLLILRTAKGPERLAIRKFTEAGGGILGLVTPAKPGDYTFCVTAIGGTPVGAVEPLVEQAFWQVTVLPTGPAPNPVPDPTPVPTPIPPPNPVPVPTPVPGPAVVPLTSVLYAMTVFTGLEDNPDEVAFARVRDTLHADDPRLKALNAVWRPLEATDPLVKTWGLDRYAPPGVTPYTVIYDTNGNVYAADGTVVPKLPDRNRYGFRTPLSADQHVAILKRLRGQP